MQRVADLRQTILGLAWLVTLAVLPTLIHAQSSNIAAQIQNGEIVGVGFFGGTATIDNAPPPGNASNEVKGFSEVLPSSYAGPISVGQIAYRTFFLNLSFTKHHLDNINKAADIRRTPTDTSDDFFVQRAVRDSNQVFISWHPKRFFSFGLGKENGTMTFDGIVAGATEKKTISFSNSFALVNFYIPFPFFRGFLPMISATLATPFELETLSAKSQTFMGRTLVTTVGIVFQCPELGVRLQERALVSSI